MADNYDPQVMEDLLAQPSVKEQVCQMNHETLQFFKDLLVSTGIYAKFMKEQEDTPDGS